MINRMNQPSATLHTKKIAAPTAPLAWRLRNTLRWSFFYGWLTHVLGHALTALTGAPVILAELRARKIDKWGEVTDYGVLSRRAITTVYVNLVVDDLQSSAAAHSTMKYHASGTGAVAENVGDTALGTEVEAARTSGTQAENAANIYESVGTISYTASRAITEHGLFSASTAGSQMDRSVFSAINVLNGDSIQFTHRTTYTSGG
jgi:hypothetical protein